MQNKSKKVESNTFSPNSSRDPCNSRRRVRISSFSVGTRQNFQILDSFNCGTCENFLILDSFNCGTRENFQKCLLDSSNCFLLLLR